MADFAAILKKYWGYNSFRPLQLEIIESIYKGCDTMALMPTGGGKSITFQVPALVMDGICIVVTPLISLMKDQVDNLRKRKISALAVHSGMTSRQIDTTLDNCIYGDYKFLYVSPERLATKIFKARIAKMNVSMIVVDEAHCISQWGYDFRPSYLKIADVRSEVDGAPVLALTATATPKVVDDIMQKLLFKAPNIKRMSFLRSNLSYVVRNQEDRIGAIVKIADSVPGTGIVYCRTRKECELTSEKLVEYGILADFYHGGLSYQMRSARQEAWIKEKTRIIVATNAFGMGIDKSNVRFVVHYEMPDSLEAYYQEAGRAGRDGNRAYAVLLSASDDQKRAMGRLSNEFPPIATIKEIYVMLFDYLGISIGEGQYTTQEFNIYDFCGRYKIYSGTVLSAIKVLQLCGYITFTEELDNPTRIMFTTNREELYKIQLSHSSLEDFIRILLRLYTGLFSGFTAIDEEYIAHMSGYTKERVGDSFKRLGQLRLIKYIPRNRSPLISLEEERLPLNNIYISPEIYHRRRETAEERLNGMLEYVKRTNKCRSLILQNYFGEQSKTPCGMCDYCITQKKLATQSNMPLQSAILELIAKGKFDIKQVSAVVGADEKKVAKEVQQLIILKKIVFDGAVLKIID